MGRLIHIIGALWLLATLLTRIKYNKLMLNIYEKLNGISELFGQRKIGNFFADKANEHIDRLIAINKEIEG